MSSFVCANGVHEVKRRSRSILSAPSRSDSLARLLCPLELKIGRGLQALSRLAAGESLVIVTQPHTLSPPQHGVALMKGTPTWLERWALYSCGRSIREVNPVSLGLKLLEKFIKCIVIEVSLIYASIKFTRQRGRSRFSWIERTPPSRRRWWTTPQTAGVMLTKCPVSLEWFRFRYLRDTVPDWSQKTSNFAVSPVHSEAWKWAALHHQLEAALSPPEQDSCFFCKYCRVCFRIIKIFRTQEAEGGHTTAAGTWVYPLSGRPLGQSGAVGSKVYRYRYMSSKMSNLRQWVESTMWQQCCSCFCWLFPSWRARLPPQIVKLCLSSLCHVSEDLFFFCCPSSEKGFVLQQCVRHGGNNIVLFSSLSPALETTLNLLIWK